MNVVKADRLAQAALPLRLDADAVGADGGGPRAGQPVERRPRAAVATCSRSRSRWLGLGAAVFLGVAAFDYRNIARLGYVLHGVGVALLLARSRCAARWWAAGGAGSTWAPFHLQPSELMQLLTIVALGKYLNDSPALEGRTWRHLAIPVRHRQRCRRC